MKQYKETPLTLQEYREATEDKNTVFRIRYTTIGSVIYHNLIFQRKENINNILDNSNNTDIKIWKCEVKKHGNYQRKI